MEPGKNLKECMAHAASVLGIPFYVIIRRGLGDFLIDGYSADADFREIAVSALEQLCSRAPADVQFDSVICVGVVRFLDESTGPKHVEQNIQRLKDLAEIIKDPGTEAAYRAWVHAWYG